MNGKGNCYINAVVETFFKTIKAELVWRRTRETRRQAKTGIFQYIKGFYNPRRRHSAFGGKKALWPSNDRQPKRAIGATQIRHRSKTWAVKTISRCGSA
jgi:transposase InsO family protein